MAQHMTGTDPASDDVPATAEPYVLEDQVGFRLRKAHQRATETFNAVMAEFGVTPTQFAALAKLHTLGPVSQNQLGRLTAMDPATIFGVVGRLMKRGLVRQSVDTDDARMVLVSLTPEGEALAARMTDLGPEVSRRTLVAFDEDEAQIFLRLLAKLG